MAYADVQVEFQYEADGVTPRYAIEHDGQKLDIDYDPLNPPSRVEDIVDSNGDRVFAHKWTSGENLLADSVIEQFQKHLMYGISRMLMVHTFQWR